MSPFIILHTADFAIGRVDKASLSHQALLELVVQGISNKGVICGDETESKGIEEWEGVTMDDYKVTEIYWGELGLQGALQVKWLPFTVTIFGACFNELTGTIDLSDLPHAMEYLDLRGNTFASSIDLRTLPEGLEELDVSDNQMTGGVDLTRLPRNLENLYMYGNRFNGSLDMTKLPENIECVYLDRNAFYGTADLSCLPRNILYLDLSGNLLSGEVFIDAALFEKVRVENTKLTKRRIEVQ